MDILKVIAKQLGHPKGLLGRFIFLPLLNWGNNHLIRSVLEKLKFIPEDTYLDIGFGGGKSLLLAAHVLKASCIKGVDPSSESILFFKKKRKEIEVFLGSCENLPFEDNSFSKISTINTIYFIPDLDKGLQEMKRILKKDGILAIGFSEKKKMKKFSRITNNDFKLFEPHEVQAILEKNGFVDVEIDENENLIHFSGDFIVTAHLSK
jgi:ubiquinone/menaquinone biosynthesis C-methylase UbiE